MTVAIAVEGCRIGGMARRANGDTTFALTARGNSDTSAVAVEVYHDAAYTSLATGTYTDGTASAGNNYQSTAYAVLPGVPPNTRLYWRARLSGVGGPVYGSGLLSSGSFRTPPSRTAPRAWTMGAIGCIHLTPSGDADVLTYRNSVFQQIALNSPDGLWHYGDFLYPESGGTVGDDITYYKVGDWYPVPTSETATASISLPRYRTMLISQLYDNANRGQAWSLAHVLASCPLYPTWDDHDFYSRISYPNNTAPISAKAHEVGYQVCHEVWLDTLRPLVEVDTTWSTDWLSPTHWFRFDYWPVRFIVIDARSYQSLGTDDASKTLATVLGTAQRDWLAAQIADTSVDRPPLTVIVSSLDLDGYHGWRSVGGADVGDNWRRSSYARAEMLDLIWTARRARTTIFITGDSHNASVCYYRGASRGQEPIWAWLASHGLGSGGHDYSNGWTDYLHGKGGEEAAAVGHGGFPVFNVTGLNYSNNMLRMDGGVDGQGPYLRLTILYTYPSGTNIGAIKAQPAFSKVYRA